MKPIFFLAAAALAFTGSNALAQSTASDDSKVNVTPGKVQYYSKLRREAVVTNIDRATRKVSLRTQAGEVVELTAGPDIKNLDKVRVGDRVVANYEENVDVSLLKGGKETVGRREESSNLEGAGGNPGATTTKKVTLTGNVTSVDQKTGVVHLQGATQSVDLTIRDPSQLALIKVGDQVQAVTTQTLALSLEPAK
jgi:hypothetical protein